jgi:hypothetical protein
MGGGRRAEINVSVIIVIAVELSNIVFEVVTQRQYHKKPKPRGSRADGIEL